MLLWRSLRVQLLVSFVAAMTMVALAELVMLYVGGGSAFEALLTQSNRILARSIRGQLQQIFQQGVEGAAALATDLAAVRNDESRNQQALRSFLSYGDLFSNAYIFDPAGRLRLAEYRPGAPGGKSHRDDDYHSHVGDFSRAADRTLQNGRATFTPIYYTPTGRPQVSYLIPVPGADGRPIELVSLALYAVSDRVNGWIHELAPTAGYLAVLDANNRVLAMTERAPASVRSAGLEPVKGLTVPEAEEVAVVVLDNREDLVNMAPIPGTGFHVVVGVPRDVAYAPLASLREAVFLAGLLALCIGILGVWQLSRGIVHAITELVGGIRRVGDGVVSHRVPERRTDELGEAAEAFNRMAARLQRDQLVEEIWRKVHGR